MRSLEVAWELSEGFERLSTTAVASRWMRCVMESERRSLRYSWVGRDDGSMIVMISRPMSVVAVASTRRMIGRRALASPIAIGIAR